jgi:hypothetical protein
MGVAPQPYNTKLQSLADLATPASTSLLAMNSSGAVVIDETNLDGSIGSTRLSNVYIDETPANAFPTTWMFISQSVASSDIVLKFQVKMFSETVGRTVRFYVLSPTFEVLYISESFDAAADGLLEFSPSVFPSVPAGGFIGVVPSANGVGFLDASVLPTGVLFRTFSGTVPTSTGTTIAPDAAPSDRRLFVGSVLANTSAVEINRYMGESPRVLYPTTWMFISQESFRNDSVLEFQVHLENEALGRTVRFYVLSPTFEVTYISESIEARQPGLVRYVPPTFPPILDGGFVAVVPSANGVAYRDGTTLPAGVRFRNFSGTIPTSTGTTISPSFEPTDRRMFVNAVLGNSSLIGYLRNDSEGLLPQAKLPRKISRQLPWSDKKIIWLGTSLPAHTPGGIDPGLNYAQLTSDLLDAELNNRAIGSSGICFDGSRVLSLSATVSELQALGQTLADARAISYEGTLLQPQPDLIVLDHHHNDQAFSVGTIALATTDRNTIAGAFNTVLNAIRTQWPTTLIAICTCPFTESSVGDFRVRAQAVRDIAKLHGLPLIDLALDCGFGSVVTNAGPWMVDGVHPSVAARERISKVLESRLNGLRK